VLDEAAALPLPELVEQEDAVCWRFVQALAQVAGEADVEFDMLDAIHRLGHDLIRERPAGPFSASGLPRHLANSSRTICSGCSRSSARGRVVHVRIRSHRSRLFEELSRNDSPAGEGDDILSADGGQRLMLPGCRGSRSSAARSARRVGR
jgi:hypothetical protein